MLPFTVYLICDKATNPTTLQGIIRHYRRQLGAQITIVVCGSQEAQIHVSMAAGCSVYVTEEAATPAAIKNQIWRSKKTPGWCLLIGPASLQITTADVEREEQRGTTIARCPPTIYLFRQDLIREINIAADESKITPIGKVVWNEGGAYNI